MPELNSCKICGSNNYSFFGYLRSWRLVKCDKCGFYYVNPRPTIEDMASYYKKDYYHKTETLENKIKELNGDGVQSVWNKGSIPLFEDISTRIKSIKPKGRILDIGCGYGFFLNVMKKNGYSTIGVEPNSLAADYAKKINGLEVFNGTLEEASFASYFFDIITMNGVLEHLFEPEKTLLECKRILKNGGLCVVSCPNAGFGLPFVYLYKIFFGDNIPVDKLKLSMFDAPNHLSFFTSRSIKALFKKVGYEILCIVNPVTIKNPNKILDLTKKTVKIIGDMLYFVSNKRILMSNSLLLFGKKI